MKRIGVALGSGTSPPDIVGCIKLAEDLGYESARIIEGHGGDQFSLLSACAVQTKRILLGTSQSATWISTILFGIIAIFLNACSPIPYGATVERNEDGVVVYHYKATQTFSYGPPVRVWREYTKREVVITERDQRKIAYLATDRDSQVAEAAVEKLTDQALLAEVVKNGSVNQAACTMAVKKLTDQALLADIIRGEFPWYRDVSLSAKERLKELQSGHR